MPLRLLELPSSPASPPRPRRAPVPGSSGPELSALARLLERGSDCLVQLDAQGFVCFANAAARAELQWPGPNPATPLHWADLLERQGDQPTRQLLRALQRHGLWEGELQLRLGDRAHVPFREPP